jgi:hypothetical protein
MQWHQMRSGMICRATALPYAVRDITKCGLQDHQAGARIAILFLLRIKCHARVTICSRYLAALCGEHREQQRVLRVLSLHH